MTAQHCSSGSPATSASPARPSTRSFCRGVAPLSSYFFKHALVQDAAYSTLWENWRSPASEWVRSFAITTTPNDLCAQLHNRISVVLKPEAITRHGSPSLGCPPRSAGTKMGRAFNQSSDMSAFRLAVFTLLVLCWGSAAPAQMKANSFIDAATLLKICDNDTPEFKKICHAYLSGIADGVTASQATGTSKPLLCIPPGTTPSHLRAALRASLKQHDSLDFGGGSSALAAILFAYPCPAGR
jgi:hypothetical protein